MSKKVVFPLIAVVGMGFAAMGCHAEAKIGNTEAKAATPPPPPPEPPPPPPPPAPKPLKAMGKAKIENNEIKIPGKIHFATDKATLGTDKETVEILQTVADVMKENTHITKLNVMGHTDDQGSHDHNVKLSQDRATAVTDWLAAKGVDKSRLVANGYGPDRPAVKNDNAADREMNRRVEFKLWELEGQATDAQKNDAANAAAQTAAVNSAAPAAGSKPTMTSTKPTTAKP